MGCRRAQSPAAFSFMPIFSLDPREIAPVETPYRRIASPFPHPDSVPLLKRLHAAEGLAMQGQPPILWDRAEGFSVYYREEVRRRFEQAGRVRRYPINIQRYVGQLSRGG